MRIVNTKDISHKITDLISDISCNINPPCVDALMRMRDNEIKPHTKFALDMMCKNAEIAKSNCTPVCQDTGMAVVFVEIGQEVSLQGDLLTDAINAGVMRGYQSLRKSIVDPLTRVNTNTNTPAVVHTSIVAGDKIKLSVMAKGFGSENMSRLFMLTPSEGIDGIIAAVVQTARLGGSNPCPPIIIGVGIGGSMEKAALMSKHALLREVGSVNDDATLIGMEGDLVNRVNALGIAAQGFGGKETCLGVFIESFPTHMSAIPVAVNVLCHCQRSKSTII